MKKFLYTIFISAFLLFQVQPVLAKYILPWYGGSATVWSVCMLFFQAGLLIGYAYSHLVTKYFTLQKQGVIHIVLLVISLISIPITPSDSFTQNLPISPVAGILWILTLSVGFPYVMISSTGPLLQYWFSHAESNKSPYRLYALSNLGSLIGLLSYPFIIEPSFGLKTQTVIWSVCYALFIVLCGTIAFSIRKEKITITSNTKEKNVTVSFNEKITWLILSFMGSLSLLSITNKLTQDIIVIPLLWIVPLALYLISFIIAFENPKWYVRKLFLPVLILVITLVLRSQYNYAVNDKESSLTVTIFLYSFLVFLLCLCLHGELARKKPEKKDLTLYYLMLSLGGVLGGVFISLIIPNILKGYWEIYIALIGSLLILSYIFLKEKSVALKGKIDKKLILLPILIFAAIGYAFYFEYKAFNNKIISSSRNFYGVLKVLEAEKGTTNWQRYLFHGDIMHGIQFMDSSVERMPISYYATTSGIGAALTYYPAKYDSGFQGMKVGIVGLGAGTITAYSTEKDLYRYYEINPEVEIIARKYFTYLKNAKGKVEIETGDGRILLENELKKNGGEQFDVLAIDAFSGDAIPTHLISFEATELYFKHLKKNGILAFHITNKYLNLMPVMAGLSESINKPLYYFFQDANEGGAVTAIWVLFTDNMTFISNPNVQKLIQPYDVASSAKTYWTDNYSAIGPLFW